MVIFMRLPEYSTYLLRKIFFRANALIFGRRLMRHEARLVAAVEASLEEYDVDALRSQLANIDLIQRWIDDRIVNIFIDKRLSCPIPSTAGRQCLATVRVVEEGREARIIVETFDGFLDRIVFEDEGVDWGKNAFTVNAVMRGGALAELPDRIDKEEHGDEQ